MAEHDKGEGLPLHTRPEASSTLRWIAIIALLLLPMVAAVGLALSQEGMPLESAAGARAQGSEGDCGEWPTQGWCTSTPAEQGMDPAKLEQMMQFVDERDMEIDSVLVVRHGKIVFEEYRNDFGPEKRHHLQSVTKSFSSMLIGIAIHEGLLEGVDQRMVDLFPDHTMANMDARKQQITLEHLLTMSDGMDWHEVDYPYSDSRNSLGQMWRSRDAVQHVLDRPMAREPGEAWAYNSGTSILLGGIIEEATGGDLLAFAREYLFDPIGIGPVFWDKTMGDHYHTDGGLYMTPRDMARFGYLMLHNGTWDGQEIVSADWVARSSTAHYQAYDNVGYGYQWWIIPGGLGYKADGHYDQKIFVLPEADMVVVFTADIPDDDPYRADGLLHSFILPACTDLAGEGGSQTYAKYGFTFEYPSTFSLFEAPLPGHDAISDASGLVQVNALSFPSEIVIILWDTPEPGASVEVYLEEYFDSVSQESGQAITPGASAEAWKDDHRLAIRFFDATADRLELAAVTGAWVCDEAHRIYIVTYATGMDPSPEDLMAAFQRYLDALVCHE